MVLDGRRYVYVVLRTGAPIDGEQGQHEGDLFDVREVYKVLQNEALVVPPVFV